MFGGNFAPAEWAFCNSQLLPISENEVLFNLIGTTYGGDGQSTFAVPDFRGRIPIHQGDGLVIGQQGGTETVTLTTSQIPSHNHLADCQNSAGGQGPSGGVWAQAGQSIYATNAPSSPMNAAALASAGGNQPHDNMMPFLAVSFIISLFGIFPSQT